MDVEQNQDQGDMDIEEITKSTKKLSLYNWDSKEVKMRQTNELKKEIPLGIDWHSSEILIFD